MKYLHLLSTLLVAQTATAASTVSTFDILVATNTLTVVGTATIQGSEFSVAQSTFLVKNAKVAIGTTTPAAIFHIAGPGVIGTSQLLWYSPKAAFRAGDFTGTPGTIGNFSIGFGLNPRAETSYATVLGGYSNWAVGDYSTVLAGHLNTAYGSESVSGGYSNAAYGEQSGALSGYFNTASGHQSVVSGGFLNFANGLYSMVPGGYWNAAGGDYSFAAGYKSSATHSGSFVWSDFQPGGEFASAAANEFRIRAEGGFVFYSNATSPTTIVTNNSIRISTSATSASAVPNIYVSSSNGNVGIGTTALGTSGHSLTTSSGVHLLAGIITMADNTVFYSTAQFASSGGGGVPSSSYTTIAANTAYGTHTGDLTVCVATVTFTPTTSSVDIIFTGDGNIAGNGYWAAVSFLVDSGYATGFNKDTAVATAANSGGSAMYRNLSFIYTDVAVTANTSHTFCLLSTHYTSSGFTMCGADSVYGPANRCRFGVREVK